MRQNYCCCSVISLFFSFAFGLTSVFLFIGNASAQEEPCDAENIAIMQRNVDDMREFIENYDNDRSLNNRMTNYSAWGHAKKMINLSLADYNQCEIDLAQDMLNILDSTEDFIVFSLFASLRESPTKESFQEVADFFEQQALDEIAAFNDKTLELLGEN